MDPSPELTLFGFVADAIGILSAVFALLAWRKTRQLKEEMEREKARQNKKVTIVLSSGTKSYELPVAIRRAELTRSEIMGHIGMIPKKDKGQPRFRLAYTNSPKFLRQIDQIVESDGDALLTIPCEPGELDQFDIDLVKG